MRKLSPEEASHASEKLANNPIIKHILSIAPEEGIEIDFEEWDLIGSPIRRVVYLAKKRKMKYISRTDNNRKKWIFVRIK